MSALFSLFAAIPRLLDLTEAVGKWLLDQVDAFRKSQAEKEMKQATDEAKKTKDTSQIDQLFDPTKKP